MCYHIFGCITGVIYWLKIVVVAYIMYDSNYPRALLILFRLWDLAIV